MKTVLIYNSGQYNYDQNIEIQEFDSKEKMIDFINEAGIGESVLAAYEIHKEIIIVPYEKVIKFMIAE